MAETRGWRLPRMAFLVPKVDKAGALRGLMGTAGTTRLVGFAGTCLKLRLVGIGGALRCTGAGSV